MKSSYNLLNIFLDGAPLPPQKPAFVENIDIPSLPELEEAYSLFDLPFCRRKISGTKLLAFDSENTICESIDRIPECEMIIVILDYSCESSIVCTFFVKRVLQIMNLISAQYPNIELVLAPNHRDWNDTILRFYPSAEG